MLAHNAMYGILLAEPRSLVQCGNVAESDDGFGHRRHSVNNTLQAITAPCT